MAWLSFEGEFVKTCQSRSDLTVWKLQSHYLVEINQKEHVHPMPLGHFVCIISCDALEQMLLDYHLKNDYLCVSILSSGHQEGTEN